MRTIKSRAGRPPRWQRFREEQTASLRDSVERYRRFFENIPDICYAIDSRWRLVMANQAMASVTAKSFRSLIGTPLPVAFPGIEESELFGVYRRVMEDRRARQVTVRTLFPDSPPGVFEVRVYPVRGGIMCIARDVTTLRQVEQNLRALLESQDLILSSIPEFIWSARFRGEEEYPLYYSPGVEQVTGYTPREMQALRDRWRELIPPEDLPDIEAALRRAREGHRVWIEHRIVRRDGEVRWVHDSITPSVEEDGSIRLDGVVSDVTERKQLEEQLHRYTDRLEDLVAERTAELATEKEQSEVILNNIADGVVLMDQGGRVVMANPVARNWLENLKPDEDRERLRRSLQEMAADPEGRSEEIVELEGLSLQAHPSLLYRNGETMVVITLHDVTRLRELDRLKTEFVSMASHELRAPVTAIKLHLNLLRHGIPGKRERYLAQLEEQVDRLTRLVENLLDLTRLDRQVVPFAPEPVDLGSLAAEVVAGFKDMAREHGLALRVEPCPHLPAVHADALQIRQVIANLLSNAMNYTPAGGEVLIWLERDDGTVSLWVRDTGIGIPEEDLPHIFKRFFRASNAARQSRSGTGLGLAIVKEIVDLHSGTIEVESTLGAGTTFRVMLPIAA